MLYALLSPAKRLDFKPLPSSRHVKATQPALLKETAVLAARARDLSITQLQRLMELSPSLAKLNHDRFQHFDPGNRTGTKPAIFTFAGDVYMGLNAATMSDEDVAFAQAHVGILSGLYGLLRPLDAIQPYRLEMGSPLKTAQADDLYGFWRKIVTDRVNAAVSKLAAPTIVNLASEEYWAAVDESQLKAPVIQATFKEMRGGKLQFLSFFAKKARGLMARAIVDHRWEKPEDLKQFNTAGYRFDPKASDEQVWVFSRKSK
jgi:cytoplasmic iron level regulating protein YaaA (DUF328/UPF0246 family)